MIIGVDVDDTIAGLVDEWLNVYNKKYKDNLQKEQISTWSISSYATKSTDKEFFELLTPKLYDKVKPIEGALEHINYLRRYYRVVFITSSLKGYMGRKQQWLIDNGFLGKDVKFCNDYVEVTDKALINYDVLVEDRADHIDAAIKNGKHGILFTQAWNKDYQSDSPFFHRANNWAQVIGFINDINYHKEADEAIKQTNEQYSRDNMDITKGGVKYDGGKPRMDLTPPVPMLELGKLFANGAKKYTDRNWEAGMRFGKPFAAMLRHAYCWLAGEEKDEETGIHHLTCVAWNALILRDLCITHPEHDDRPKYDDNYLSVLKDFFKNE